MTSVMPGYTELRELGRGMQGRVVLARSNSNSGDVVAIKYLASELISDVSRLASFRHEAELLSQLRHPNLVRIHEYLETGQQATIVMDAVDGISLKELLTREERLTLESALVVLKGSLLGLQAAHEMNVVHRDYKPANVMVEADGTSKLIDFGLAGLVGDRTLGGTPGYMAPEQWRGKTVPATDVYAATCVFFECITGHLPFQGNSTTELAAQHTNAPIPLEAVPEELRELISQGMAKHPSGRPPMAQDFVNDLETVAAETYGPDWETRGLIALGAAAAALAALFPLALAASAMGTSTLAGTSIAQASTVTAGKGLISKIGGRKGMAGISAGSTAVAIGVVLLWPGGPRVGGVSHGFFKASFTKPSVLLNQPYMPEAATPFVTLDMTITPARIRPGMKLKVTTLFHAKTIQGAKYLPGGALKCFGEKPAAGSGTNSSYGWVIGRNFESTNGAGRVWFHRVHAKHDIPLPIGSGIYVVGAASNTGESQPYIPTECAFISDWTMNRVITVPDTDELPPGRYQVTIASPLVFTSVKSRGREIPLESVGPKIEGALPILTILK